VAADERAGAGAAPDVASEIRSEVSKEEIYKSFQYFE
jgi:hypothetical protein